VTTYRNRIGVIDQECYCLAMPCRRHRFVPIRHLPRNIFLGLRWPILLLIKVNEQQHLVLNGGKEIMFLDEIEYFWSAEAE
jgi:hypothetical protein